MPDDARDPQTFLPLPHLEYQILVSLADARLHGYAIVKEIGARSPDTSTPSTGSLYLAIARLLENGLIRDAADTMDSAVGGETGATGRNAGAAERRSATRPKRTYCLTEVGRAVAAAETERLMSLARLAEDRLRPGRPATSAASRGRR